MDTEDNKGFKEVQSSRHQFVSRMQVSGGWLYELVRAKTGQVSITFVPDAEKATVEQKQALLRDVFVSLDRWAKADMDKYNQAAEIKKRLFIDLGIGEEN